MNLPKPSLPPMSWAERLGQAVVMAKEGYGVEDVMVRLKLPRDLAKMIVFGKKK